MEELKHRCYMCRTADASITCPDCGVARYCSSGCQAYHCSALCRKLQSMRPNATPVVVVAAKLGVQVEVDGILFDDEDEAAVYIWFRDTGMSASARLAQIEPVVAERNLPNDGDINQWTLENAQHTSIAILVGRVKQLIKPYVRQGSALARWVKKDIFEELMELSQFETFQVSKGKPSPTLLLQLFRFCARFDYNPVMRAYNRHLEELAKLERIGRKRKADEELYERIAEEVESYKKQRTVRYLSPEEQPYLPMELYLQIAMFLPAQDVMNLIGANKRLYRDYGEAAVLMLLHRDFYDVVLQDFHPTPATLDIVQRLLDEKFPAQPPLLRAFSQWFILSSILLDYQFRVDVREMVSTNEAKWFTYASAPLADLLNYMGTRSGENPRYLLRCAYHLVAFTMTRTCTLAAVKSFQILGRHGLAIRATFDNDVGRNLLHFDTEDLTPFPNASARILNYVRDLNDIAPRALTAIDEVAWEKRLVEFFVYLLTNVDPSVLVWAEAHTWIFTRDRILLRRFSNDARLTTSTSFTVANGHAAGLPFGLRYYCFYNPFFDPSWKQEADPAFINVELVGSDYQLTLGAELDRNWHFLRAIPEPPTSPEAEADRMLTDG